MSLSAQTTVGMAQATSNAVSTHRCSEGPIVVMHAANSRRHGVVHRLPEWRFAPQREKATEGKETLRHAMLNRVLPLPGICV